MSLPTALSCLLASELIGLLLQELTVNDTALLLAAYKQAAHLKQKEYLKAVQSTDLHDTSSELLSHFSHYSSGSLRVVDVKQILQDLQQNPNLSYIARGKA